MCRKDIKPQYNIIQDEKVTGLLEKDTTSKTKGYAQKRMDIKKHSF